jgi:23S rRNA pseudouridine1911/1915/1917 synthase
MILSDWLARKYPTAKRQTLKRMVEAGRVRINGHRASRLKQLILPEDKLDVTDAPVAKASAAPSPTGLAIVYEDEDLLVLNKPAGLLTSTNSRERRATLLARVREYLAQTPRCSVGLIHRLDRDASGLLVFSKSNQAYRSLKSQFFEHTVKREYRAVVHGIPEPSSGHIETCLIERADGTVHSTRQIGKGQPATTEYETLKTQGKSTLLRVVLHTGRKHQIRVHLAERGNPVVGDRTYGPTVSAPRLMLAATSLTVRHPRTGEVLNWQIPLPREFPVRES